MTKSILSNIKNVINSIPEFSELQKTKAINLCSDIYGLYVITGGDFHHYVPLKRDYFAKRIGSKKFLYPIKDNLIKYQILEVYTNNNGVESYCSNDKGSFSKSYRFNSKLINGYYTTSGPTSGPTTDITTYSNVNSLNNNLIKLLNNQPYHICGPLHEYFKLSNVNSLNNNLIKLLNNQPYHICGPLHETYINKQLQRITFKEETKDYIENFAIKTDNIKVDEDIQEEFIQIHFQNEDYRYRTEKARELAKEMNCNLILYKNKKGYIENVNDFMNRKSHDMRLILRKGIFDIENKIFRISRNETNRRLDYNLTNMKSELLDYMLIDGEELVELDIANAQFAILSYITNDLDTLFIEKAQNGTLYEGNKQEWFKIAFDKIKKEQDGMRELFPKTMEFIDNFKSQCGYNKFSILLQNIESIIMIDGLLTRLIEKGFNVFTIHDAIRVKKSELERVKQEIDIYFNEIGFKCHLRIKDKKKLKIK